MPITRPKRTDEDGDGTTASFADAAPYTALLREIVEDPRDSGGCALVLADWCEDHGRGWEAALIRQPHPPLGSPRTRAMREYRARLAACRYPPLLNPARVWPLNRGGVDGVRVILEEGAALITDSEVCVDVVHGFVTGLACTWRHFRRHAGDWLARNPVGWVYLFGPYPADDLHKARYWEDVERMAGPPWWFSWRPARCRGDWYGALPPEVWERLTGYVTERDWHGETHRCYEGEPAARLAASRAAVAWGREQARLPAAEVM
jgi:uncharacterized protein (TIGR02996 family)